MKKSMKLRVWALAIMVFSAVAVQAQPCDPGDPDNPNPCPIDGGVSLLIAAGIGLGAKKAYDRKQKEKNNF